MKIKSNKRIWLVNKNAMPPHLEPRLRTIKFAQYLTEKGYDVTIFASSVMHNMNINLIEDSSRFIEKSYDGIKFVFINTKMYKTNGLSRIISSIQFPVYLKKISNEFLKPDIIILTTAVPFGNIAYYLLKKIKAKFIIEVLDLWPHSFVSLGIMKPKNPLLYLLYKAEKWLYKKADAVVFSMEGGRKYIEDKGWNIGKNKIDLKKVYYINNGVDLTDFECNVNNFTLQDSDLNNNYTKKVIYVGSIRLANNLKQLIDAAALLKKEQNIKFLIYGNGDDRNKLEEYCKVNNLYNVLFKDKWIEPKFIPYLLSKSTVNILNYSKNFGDYGGSQSKLFQYMASGKPICSNIQMMFCPITKYNIGIAKKFNNPQEYADSILNLVNLNEDEFFNLSKRAKEAAKEFDYKHLTDKLVVIFNSIE